MTTDKDNVMLAAKIMQDWCSRRATENYDARPDPTSRLRLLVYGTAANTMGWIVELLREDLDDGK